MFNMNEFELDRNGDQHLYIQLYNYIKRKIMDNSIPPHTKLPPIRELARMLDINNVTVVSAYKMLEQNNYVYKRVGSGTYVQDISKLRHNHDYLDEEINIHGDNSEMLTTSISKANIINFANTAPSPELFPVSDFKSVLNEVLDRDKGNAFTYQEIEGYFPLRSTIKSYIEKYGIKVNTQSIQIVSGAQQAIDILSKALVDYGDVVFTESPTYNGALAVFKSRGAKIIEIPIEEDGMDLRVLENKLKSFKPKFIYVMPNFQNPTGYTYSKEKKQRLLELANEHNSVIIEDDYISELAFSNDENLSLKSLDVNDRVVYIKSFSKIFMPGIRLALMIVPISIYSDVLSAKHISDISTSGLIQRAFDLYLRKGLWEKHIERMKKAYNNKYIIMTDSINKHFPKELNYHIPKGGLNFWFSLPDGYSSNEFYKFCSSKDIAIVPGSIFYSDKKDIETFRLSIASIDEKKIDAGVREISSVLRLFLDEHSSNKKNARFFNSFL